MMIVSQKSFSSCVQCLHPDGERCNGTKCKYDHIHYDKIEYENDTFELCFYTKKDADLFMKTHKME